MSDKDIKHRGSVVSSTNGVVSVSIISESACLSCKAKSACGMSEQSEKMVDVYTEYTDKFMPGEEVIVSIKQSMGIYALFYVYILPFILVFSSLVSLLKMNINEAAAGGISLGVLVLYYFCLYLLRGRIEKEIHFELEKIS